MIGQFLKAIIPVFFFCVISVDSQLMTVTNQSSLGIHVALSKFLNIENMFVTAVNLLMIMK